MHLSNQVITVTQRDQLSNLTLIVCQVYPLSMFGQQF